MVIDNFCQDKIDRFSWLCARLQPSAPSIRGRLLEAYGSRAGTPGVLGCGCMIGQPAARQPLHDIVVKAGEEARCAPAVERIYP